MWPEFERPGYLEWQRTISKQNKISTLSIVASIYGENGSLKPMTLSNWDDDFIQLKSVDSIATDDDIPF